MTNDRVAVRGDEEASGADVDTPQDEDGGRGIAGSDPNRRFKVAIRQFIATCDALLELAKALRPHVDELDVRPSTLLLEEVLGSRLKNEDRDAFRQAMGEAIASMLRGSLPSDQSRDDHPSDSTSSPLRVRLTAKKLDQMEAYGRALHRELREAAVARPKKRQLLHRSLLTSLIASLEVLIGNTVAAFYFANPASLGGDEKEFSLADLQSLGSIDDAVEEAIARRTDAFMYQSTADWRKWFSRTTKTDFDDIAIDWQTTNEIIERRHVIVHNGGRASKQYLQRTGLVGSIPVGTELVVEDEYFSGAVDQVLVFGVLLAATTWAHVQSDAGRSPGGEVQDLTEQLMRSKRWVAVQKLTEVALQRLAAEEIQRHTFQFNCWLARKEIRGLDSIREDLHGFDDSALIPVFRFVRYALMERYEEATGMVEHLIESKAIPTSALRDWPVLAGLRQHPPFAADLDKRLAAERRRFVRRQAQLLTRRDPADGTQATTPEDKARLADGEASFDGSPASTTTPRGRQSRRRTKP